MSIKCIFYFIWVFAAGVGISAGYVAFITLLGVFDKLLLSLKFKEHTRMIESCIICGVTLGNTLYVLDFVVPIWLPLLILMYLFGGIFVGCLIGALSETLNLFPILSRRTKLRKGLPYILLVVALGKAFGNIIYSLFLNLNQ